MYFMKQSTLSGLQQSRQVKDYICSHFCEESNATQNALRVSEKMGLKAIQIPLNVAKTLYLLAKLVRPKRILEIGTLGGYSTLWLARALEDGGTIITIECVSKHAQIARENFAFADLENQIEVRVGLALDVLNDMIEKKEGPFDLIFIDADKAEYPKYLEPCLALSRSGTLILSDNLIPKRGDIANPDPRDNEAVGIYAFNQMIANHPSLETNLISTIVGEKGRLDALGVSLVR